MDALAYPATGLLFVLSFRSVAIRRLLTACIER